MITGLWIVIAFLSFLLGGLFSMFTVWAYDIRSVKELQEWLDE